MTGTHFVHTCHFRDASWRNDPPNVYLQVARLLQTIEHPTEGTLRVAGPAASWSRTLPSIRHYPPRLGEHGTEILSEAGLSDDEIEALLVEGGLINADTEPG